MNDFQTLLKKRRAIRDFLDRPVPLETIQDIIRDSCLAPSAGNGQPWRFVVVNRKDMIKRLSDESKKNFIANLERNPNSPIKKYEAVLKNEAFNVFYNAPCLVYVVGPKSIVSLQVDCALAVAYFMLSAASRGLGTCWVDLGAFIRDPELLKELGIPEDCRIVAPVILGYPSAIPDPPQRKDPGILKVIS
jgi:nitroreductase